ncbi:unnamed protein product (macronuclear) [Paramecium tetraurelia]|uniref:Uncharacterized protein n=1 Tax=Paramecium tetraurelia TaxID=5888 RepID=A0CAR0_PARTE|nr:uncharacterized protein GSPATT00036658001 [Paramecium tetraurelia]CAK67877.1 unnamed protein product [Paramecium tetraurelia]|eukprot:XP_001435274.1 hypothetical protein (macronuclear) [Paramecium tetraurelia strain d4-2]
MAVQEDEILNQVEYNQALSEDQEDSNQEQIQKPDLPLMNSSSKKAASRSDEEEGEKQKKKTGKKKPAQRRDDNYLKIIEYSDLKIQAYILSSKEEDITTSYELTITFSYQDYQYSVNCKAVILCEPKQPFTLSPIKFEDAISNSQFPPFFLVDTYFNVDLQLNSNLQSFNQLLEVKRNTQAEKKDEDSPHQFTKRQSKIANTQVLNGAPTKPKRRKKREAAEMMELIHVFDFECSPRLNQILVSLMIQQYSHKITKYLITINDVYFIFNEKPSLDKQEVHRILIFYEHFDYSLSELSEYLHTQKLQLSHICHLQLSLNLLQILYYTYTSYLYRLNITLNTVFWVSKVKKFKLQTFGRIQNLLDLDGKDFYQKFKTANEGKINVFYRDFDRDFGAVLDIIAYFKDLSKEISQIKKMRRKRKNLPEGETYYSKYIIMYDELFADNVDSLFLGLVRLKFFDNNSFDQILEEIKSIIVTIDKLIKQETAKIESDKLEKEQEIQEQQQQASQHVIEVKLEDDEDEEELHKLQSFNFALERKKKKDLTQEQYLYYQMIYSSLFYNQNFNMVCDQFLEITKNQTLIAYAQLHYSIWRKLSSVVKEGYSLEQQTTLLSISKNVTQLTLSQDSFHYYLLLELITKIRDKPFNIINHLKALVQEQNFKRKRQVKPKLSRNQKFNGIIEMRKAIFLDLFFIDHYVSDHQYHKAIYLMQFDLSSQLKFNLKNYMLYTQSLFLNGLLCEKTLQSVSAMLNLEISKLLYDQFFPNTKIVYIEDETQRQVTKEQMDSAKQYTSKIIHYDNQACENMNVLDFHLGKVYFSIHDKENALKCLRKVKKARQKKFDILSDEVIEVIIEILRILVEQDDSGAAAEICYEYQQKFKEQYKKNAFFKSRYIARLQLIMGAIFEQNGMLLSSLRYFQKANKTFNQSRSNSYILQIHIRMRIMKLISAIKNKALSLNSINKGQTKQFNYQTGYMSETVKPYFNNQFLRQAIEEKQAQVNQVIFNNLLKIYSLFRHQEYDKVQDKLNRLHNVLKKRKVDECYGYTLQKIGIYNATHSSYVQAINYLKLATEIHERFLIFPLKEIRQLRCQILILHCWIQLEKKKEYQDQLNYIDSLVTSINEMLSWSNIPYKPITNKFTVLSLKLGKQIIYQLDEMSQIIEKFQKTRYKLIEHLSNPSKLKSVAAKYLKHLIKATEKEQIKKKSHSDSRQSCLFGLLSRQNVRPKKVAAIVAQNKSNTQTEFEYQETQKSTNTRRSNLKHRENTSFQFTSEKSHQIIQQLEGAQTQKSQFLEDNLETERNGNLHISYNIKENTNTKCSTGMPSMAQLNMTPISEMSKLSQKSPKQKGNKDQKKLKINPFQKITRK